MRSTVFPDSKYIYIIHSHLKFLIYFMEHFLFIFTFPGATHPNDDRFSLWLCSEFDSAESERVHVSILYGWRRRKLDSYHAEMSASLFELKRTAFVTHIKFRSRTFIFTLNEGAGLFRLFSQKQDRQQATKKK